MTTLQWRDNRSAGLIPRLTKTIGKRIDRFGKWVPDKGALNSATGIRRHTEPPDLLPSARQFPGPSTTQNGGYFAQVRKDLVALRDALPVSFRPRLAELTAPDWPCGVAKVLPYLRRSTLSAAK